MSTPDPSRYQNISNSIIRRRLSRSYGVSSEMYCVHTGLLDGCPSCVARIINNFALYFGVNEIMKSGMFDVKSLTSIVFNWLTNSVA